MGAWVLVGAGAGVQEDTPESGVGAGSRSHPLWPRGRQVSAEKAAVAPREAPGRSPSVQREPAAGRAWFPELC